MSRNMSRQYDDEQYFEDPDYHCMVYPKSEDVGGLFRMIQEHKRLSVNNVINSIVNRR